MTVAPAAARHPHAPCGRANRTETQQPTGRLRSRPITIRANITAFTLAAAALTDLAGCGQSGPSEKGLLVSGLGIRAAQPPWASQYAGLAQGIKTLGLPTGSSDKFHIHAQLSVYNEALLVTVPANIGIDHRHHIETTIHTHDQTGIIHMEAPRPYPYTLGDLFAIWGVRSARARSAPCRTTAQTASGCMSTTS